MTEVMLLSRIEIMVKAKSQFKRRSTANNVEIVVPVPSDADSPKFKTTIGRFLLWGLQQIIYKVSPKKLS